MVETASKRLPFQHHAKIYVLQCIAIDKAVFLQARFVHAIIQTSCFAGFLYAYCFKV